jgi:hypothetical protein
MRGAVRFAILLASSCLLVAPAVAQPDVAPAPATPSAPDTRSASCPGGDADQDLICDDVELATGTKPFDADTDGDGVPDGVEDANQDGVVDRGETDPRQAGLFPGSYPFIPEPMVFDLVRALGAQKGEREANVLLVMRLEDGRPNLLWAPEVEWAFADGLAIEFELPMHDRELEALKAAFQGTFPNSGSRFIHGVQVIGEYLLTPRETELTGLYLAGVRVNGVSLFSMFGVRATTPMRGMEYFEALINPSVSLDVTEAFTVGVENNIAIGWTGHVAAAVIPQLHYQVSHAVRIQVGGGVSFDGGRRYPILATRFILE